MRGGVLHSADAAVALAVALALALTLTAGTALAGFSGTEVYLPSVGRGEGSNGSNWRTTVWVHNPGTQVAHVQIRLLERAQSNQSAQTFPDTVEPGETKTYPDIIQTIFGVRKFGALRFLADARLIVTSRVYSQPYGGLEKDTTGQFFAGLPAGFAIGAGERTQLLAACQQPPEADPQYRYNFGIVETTGSSVDVSVELLDAQGVPLASRGLSFGPFGVAQYSLATEFPGVSTQDARLQIVVIGGAGKILAFGSRIANASNDPATVEMSFRDDLLAGSGPSSALTEVAHDGSLQGQGTATDPLEIAPVGVTTESLAPYAVTQDKLSASGIATTGSFLATTGSSLEWRAAPTFALPFSGSTDGDRVALRADNTTAIGDAFGLVGEGYSPSGVGVWGGNPSNAGSTFGVMGMVSSPDGAGVAGYNDSPTGGAVGVYGVVSSYYQACGVWGVADAATGGSAGVRGESDGTNGFGVIGSANAATGTNVGVYGYTNSWEGYAGYFDGAARVIGYLYKSGGGFQIDHPQHPDTKYLNHFFVESTEMKNVYDGVAVLDAAGQATVALPGWFEALNEDFRYQLTCIGNYAPVFVSREVGGGSFAIAGGRPGMKVSWQVTGVRRDPWALAHRLPVEQDKPEAERGTYLNEEANPDAVAARGIAGEAAASPQSMVPPPAQAAPRRPQRTSVR